VLSLRGRLLADGIAMRLVDWRAAPLCRRLPEFRAPDL